MRNRTMALLTDATIVVEAADRSGCWHQAIEALRLGRMLLLDSSIDFSLKAPRELTERGARVLTPADADRIVGALGRSRIQVVRAVSLDDSGHACALCLLLDTRDDDATVYAVAVRLGDFVGHWSSGHLVTAERWTDEALRCRLVWRPAAEAEAGFNDRLATFSAGPRTSVEG